MLGGSTKCESAEMIRYSAITYPPLMRTHCQTLILASSSRRRGNFLSRLAKENARVRSYARRTQPCYVINVTPIASSSLHVWRSIGLAAMTLQLGVLSPAVKGVA